MYLVNKDVYIACSKAAACCQYQLQCAIGHDRYFDICMVLMLNAIVSLKPLYL